MFSWYARAEMCFAYLEDYCVINDIGSLSSSRWFNRGWTLQELIAPPQVQFFDCSWNMIGTKHSLSEELSSITGIKKNSLLASTHGYTFLVQHLSRLPLARRMAWAGKRETTRVEDLAYCLLGIFGVNLPLLYGEGRHAFIRLQEEILKSSNDMSLFAWRTENLNDYPSYYCGILASHPKYFQNSSAICLTNDAVFAPDFILTNKGIKIETQMRYSEEHDLHVLDINCHNGPDHDLDRGKTDLGILLKHRGASVFVRASPYRLVDTHGVLTNQKHFFLSTTFRHSIDTPIHKVQCSAFLFPEVEGPLRKVVRICPEAFWDSGQRTFLTAGLQNFVAFAEISVKSAVTLKVKSFFTIFGFGYGFAHWVRLVSADSVGIDRVITQKNWQQVANLANEHGSHVLELYSGVSGHGETAELFEDIVNVNLDERPIAGEFVVNHSFSRQQGNTTHGISN